MLGQCFDSLTIAGGQANLSYISQILTPIFLRGRFTPPSSNPQVRVVW